MANGKIVKHVHVTISTVSLLWVICRPVARIDIAYLSVAVLESKRCGG